MTPHALLEFAYLRSKADNGYRLFLRIDPSIIGQEIEIGLTDKRQLNREIEDGALLVTRTPGILSSTSSSRDFSS